ncbi:hypothetical protein PVAP13_1KG084254 [Panicum virgatum]|uniref:Uncharacterized protein n=1 Tax=Panicum virgatum TaxID=38727 RepID=A0A8T0XGG6_PANVG|nr:hypothetical protein PVAP13_1KG084254 [Panicum virgatum]
MMLCHPRRLCRLITHATTRPLLATALSLFSHQYPITPLSASASSWSIKGAFVQLLHHSQLISDQPGYLPNPISLALSFPARARICSSLSHPDELIVLLSPRVRNDDDKKPGVRCREIGSSYRKQKLGVRTASRKSKRAPRVELPVC